MRKTPTRVSRFPGAARPARWRLAAALLAVLAALAPAPARAAEKPAAKDKGAAADKPGDKSADKAGKARKVTPAERFLREAEGKLDNFTFGSADLAAAEKFAKQAKTPAGRLPFDLLVARYQRECQNRPDRAAAAVLPHLFPKETAAAWEKETAKLRKEAPKAAPAKDGKAKTGAKEAQGGEGGEGAANAPAAPLAPLPPAGEWNLTPENAPAAVEAAACLAAAGQMAEALSVVNRVGAGFADANRVIAVELAGDLNRRIGKPSQAVSAYQYGIDYLNRALGTEKHAERNSDGGYVKEYSGRERSLRARLERKLGEARREQEAEQYGPDWVLYRDATRKDWEQHDSVGAYLLYRRIVDEYANTVYAEAARCYSIKCLLKFAKTSKTIAGESMKPIPGLKMPQAAVAILAKDISALEKGLAASEKILQAAVKAKAPTPIVRRLRGAIAHKKQHLRDLRQIPIGDKALKIAREEAAVFLGNGHRLGLYRGEVLLALADFALEELVDAEEAAIRYAEAAAWLEQVDSADKALAEYSLPGKAEKVAAPPATERYKDRWGNNKIAAPAPGALFNRHTADWYLIRLRKKILLRQGLLCYADGDYDGAKKHWDRLYELDRFYKDIETEGWGSVCSRLNFALQNNTGALYLTRKEIGGFTNHRRRMLIFLGDLHYVNEEPREALRYYWRLLNEEFGKLSHDEKAEALFRVFSCCCFEFKVDEIAFLDQYLNELRGTNVEAVALFGLGNRAGVNGGEKGCRTAEKYFTLLRKYYPKSQQALDSLFISGWGYRLWAKEDASKHKEAIRFFQEYIRKQKCGGYIEIAKQWLAEEEKENR